MPHRSIYADLFDDGITPFNYVLEDISGQQHDFEKRLLDSVRFQVLVAILFDRQIAVPESWMASSPLFLRVFAEIDRSFSSIVRRTDAGGAVDTFARFPFSFTFFQQASESPAEDFLRALSFRLSQGRRIRWLPTSGVFSDADDLEAKKLLANGIDNFLKTTGKIEGSAARKFGHWLFMEMETVFGSAQGKGYGALAVAVGSLLERLASFEGRNAVRFWGKEGRERQLRVVGSTVQDVLNVVSTDPKIFDAFPDEIVEFRSFFEEAQRSGKSMSDIMGMWPILQNYDPRVAKTAEAFGRLALNRGYASSTAASQSTLSFDFYEAARRGSFTEKLLSRTVDIREESVPEYASSRFLELAPASMYDLSDTLNWEDVWKAVGEVSQSHLWRNEREVIEREIIHTLEGSAVDTDAWLKLFDKLNSLFQNISFELVEETETPTARIIQKIKDEADDAGHMDRLVKLVKATASLSGLAGVFGTTGQLLEDKRHTQPALKLLRKLRRLKNINARSDIRNLVVSRPDLLPKG
ncbi:MAG: hypothetical protein ACPGNV_12260 [Mangrovicoccus sp.]